MFLKISNFEITTENFIQLDATIKIFISGYIIWNKKLYWGEEFIPILKKHYDEQKIIEKIKHYNGIFYFIIIDKTGAQIFIDRYGFLPLMYTRNSSNEILISNSSDNLLNKSFQWNNEALIDYFVCGFCIGDKTIIKGISEFLPHRIYTIVFNNGKLEISEKSYWQLNLKLNSISKNEAKQKLKNIIDEKFNIYTNYIKENGNKILMPISGGLDSRFLLNEFDKRNVGSLLITFGGDKNNYDLKRGLELGFSINNSLGHFIHVNSNDFLKEIFKLPTPSNRIVTAQPIELYYYAINKFKNEIPFFISGQSGGFLTGSHMRLKMKNWNKKEDALTHIFKFKTSPFVKYLSKDHKEYLYNEIYHMIPDYVKPIDMLYLWEMENRQRKYMTRYSLYEGDRHGLKVLMPFYDYDLFDLFTSLQFEELLNQKFFIHCMKDFIYSNNQKLLQIKRVNKPIKNVHNHYIAEYLPKIKNLITSKLKIKNKHLQFISEDFEWREGIEMKDIPAILHPYIREKSLGTRQNSALIQLKKIIKHKNP